MGACCSATALEQETSSIYETVLHRSIRNGNLASVKRLIEDEGLDVNVINGEFKVCKTMSYVLSVDHRIVDGAIASKLLKYFKFFINNPSAMLI